MSVELDRAYSDAPLLKFRDVTDANLTEAVKAPSKKARNAPTIKGLTYAVDNRGVRVHDTGAPCSPPAGYWDPEEGWRCYESVSN